MTWSVMYNLHCSVTTTMSGEEMLVRNILISSGSSPASAVQLSQRIDLIEFFTESRADSSVHSILTTNNSVVKWFSKYRAGRRSSTADNPIHRRSKS